VVVVLSDLLTDIVYVDVYDTRSRTLTKVTLDGPLAELIADRCLDSLGRTVVSGLLTDPGPLTDARPLTETEKLIEVGPASSVGLIPTEYEAIYLASRRRPRHNFPPRIWVLEVDPSLAETYRTCLEDEAKAVETAPTDITDDL
jgi:hypothetical protein